VRLCKAARQQADLFEQQRVAGHRAANHVAKYPRDTFIKGKVRDRLRQRVGKELVARFGHWLGIRGGKARILRQLSALQQFRQRAVQNAADGAQQVGFGDI